jgi:hypothetical protein
MSAIFFKKYFSGSETNGQLQWVGKKESRGKAMWGLQWAVKNKQKIIKE